MKVLFLDVDGVLNCHRDFEVIAYGPILNRRMVERLNKIVRDTGCQIVLSSAWRMGEDLCDVLKRSDVLFQSKTPALSTTRGAEIQSWLDAHPEVTDYCIVDDDGDMLTSQLRRFVQTDPEHGLTDTLAYRITWILNHGIRDDLGRVEASANIRPAREGMPERVSN